MQNSEMFLIREYLHKNFEYFQTTEPDIIGIRSREIITDTKTKTGNGLSRPVLFLQNKWN